MLYSALPFKLHLSVSGSVAHVLDSLEEIHALSDGGEKDLEFLQSLLDDKALHGMLDVRFIHFSPLDF